MRPAQHRAQREKASSPQPFPVNPCHHYPITITIPLQVFERGEAWHGFKVVAKHRAKPVFQVPLRYCREHMATMRDKQLAAIQD